MEDKEFKQIGRALMSGSVQVMAQARINFENHPFRIIAVRFEEGKPYGKCLSDGCWYPITYAEITYDARSL